jgi:hypothetical protein
MAVWEATMCRDEEVDDEEVDVDPPHPHRQVAARRDSRRPMR